MCNTIASNNQKQWYSGETKFCFALLYINAVFTGIFSIQLVFVELYHILTKTPRCKRVQFAPDSVACPVK